jgi:hypothetical protein
MADLYTAEEVLELATQVDIYIAEIRPLNTSPNYLLSVTDIKSHLEISNSPDAALKKLSTLTGPFGDYDNQKFIFKKPLKAMPKYINHPGMKKVIALWRLSIGK